MQNKEREKMFKYGEWLEKYLDPNLNVFAYKKLFQVGASDLLKTHEAVDEDSPLLKSIEDREKDNCSEETTSFFEFKNDVLSLLRELKESRYPWERELYGFQQQQEFHVINDLERSYSELYNTVRANLGEYKRVTSFLKIGELEGRLPNGRISFNPLTHVDLNDVYKIIVARILFDFLFMGGYSHFVFCECCNRFALVRRSGKRFCSDICRSSYNLKK